MSKHLTTEKEVNQKLIKLKEPIQSEAQVNEMIGLYPKVIQGIAGADADFGNEGCSAGVWGRSPQKIFSG